MNKRLLKRITAFVLTVVLVLGDVSVASAATDYDSAVSDGHTLSYSDDIYTLSGTMPTDYQPENAYLNFYDPTTEELVGAASLVQYTHLNQAGAYSHTFTSAYMQNTGASVIPAGSYKLAWQDSTGTIHQLNAGAAMSFPEIPLWDTTDEQAGKISGSDMMVSTNGRYFFSGQTFTDYTLEVDVTDLDTTAGETYTYQWYCNGVPLANEISNTYYISSLTLNSSEDNKAYYCRVNNGTNTLYSMYTRFHYDDGSSSGPVFGFCWPDESVSNDPYAHGPLSNYLNTAKGYGTDVWVIFTDDQNGEQILSVSDLAEANAGILDVTDPGYSNGMVRFVTTGWGDTEVTYKDSNNQVHTITIRSELQNFGYYSADSASQANWIRYFDYTGTDKVFYFMPKSSTDSVSDWTPTAALSDIATVETVTNSDGGSYYKITLTGTPVQGNNYGFEVWDANGIQTSCDYIDFFDPNGGGTTGGGTGTGTTNFVVSVGTQTLALAQGQNQLTFTPSEDGYYYFETSDGQYLEPATTVNSFRFTKDNARYDGAVHELKQGVTYTFDIGNMGNSTVDVTVEKAVYSTTLDVRYNNNIREYVGFPTSYPFELAQGAIDNITATSQNTNVLVATGEGNRVRFDGKSAGTATVALSTMGGATASVNVEVYEVHNSTNPYVLTDNQSDTYQLYKNQGTQFTFKATQDGTYLIYNSRSFTSIDQMIQSAAWDYTDAQSSGWVVEMKKDETITAIFRTPNGDASGVIGIMPVTYATGIEVNQGQAISGAEGTRVTIPIAPVNGNVFRGVSVSTANGAVASVWNEQSYGFDVQFENPGTTTIEVSVDDGTGGKIVKTVNVETVAYSSTVNQYWADNVTSDQTVTITYTPDVSGWYFLHQKDERRNNDGLYVKEGTGYNSPLNSFAYDENGYSGDVYELEAGKTYTFEARCWSGNYEFYMKKVDVPDTFTVTPSLSGKIDEELELEIFFTGALSTKITSSNKEVAIPGGGNARSNTVFLVGAGTATLTVTDFRGNTQTCIVNVSNDKLPTQTFGGWDEMGLASGASVTYRYTPGQTGKYWINSELNHHLGIQVCEAGQSTLLGGTRHMASNSNGKDGYVYDLTAGTTYEITFTATDAMSTFINAQLMQEADSISLMEGERTVQKGDTENNRVWFDLQGTQQDGYTLWAPGLTVVSSDPTVVDVVLVENNHAQVEYKKAGTATLTFTYKGVSQTCRIRVEHKAQNILVNNGNSLTGIAGDVVVIPISPVGEGEIEQIEAWTEDGRIAGVGRVTSNSLEVRFNEPGQTVIRINANQGIEKELQVTTQSYVTDAIRNWTGAPDGDNTYTVTYTPDADGWYFLCFDHDVSYELQVGESSAQPLQSMDYHSVGYAGVLYQLEKDETYHFISHKDEPGDVDLYLKKLDIAGSFTVTPSLSGDIDGRGNLEFQYTGVLPISKVTTSNPEVVLAGGHDNYSCNVYFVGEGSATLTVEDLLGNKQICQVTVSSEEMPVQQLEGGRMIGLASDAEVTFRYTADENGSYWIFGENETSLGIQVKDGNNNVWSGYGFAASNSNCRSGMVYDFREGESYEITFTNPGSAMLSYIEVQKVFEADDLQLQTTEIAAAEGDTMELWYDLSMSTGDMGPLVAKLTVTSSDDTVAKVVSVERDFTTIRLVGGGEATITFKIDGDEVATCRVTSTGRQKIELDTATSLTLNPDEAVEYLFTPDQSGTYVITHTDSQGLVEVWAKDTPEEFLQYSWVMEENDVTQRGSIFYDLVAGESYVIEFWLPPVEEGQKTFDFTMEKTGAATSFELDRDAKKCLAGDIACVSALFASYKNMEDVVEWTVTDADGQETESAVIHSSSPTGVYVLFTEAGEYVVQATCGSFTDSCTITVVDTVPADGITLDASDQEVGIYSELWVDIVASPDTETEKGVFTSYTIDISDESILALGDENDAGFGVVGLRPGTARVTVTLDNGVNASIDIDVWEHENVVLGQLYEMEFDAYEDSAFQFVPENSGTYQLTGTAENSGTVIIWNPMLDFDGTLVLGLDNHPLSGTLTFELEADQYYLIIPGADETASKVTFMLSKETSDPAPTPTPTPTPTPEPTPEPAHSHSMSRTEAKAASCTEAGNIEYYTCAGCGGMFLDEAGNTGVSAADTVISASHKLQRVAPVAATCTANGVREHYKCEVCNTLFGNTYATVVMTTYGVTIEAAHRLTKVEAVPATYTAEGNVEHYSCSVCDELFEDEDGKTVLENVRIPKLTAADQTSVQISEEVIKQTVAESDENGEVVVDLKEAEDLVEVSLPVVSLKELVETETSLSIELPQASVILDKKTLEAIVEAAGEGEITLKVEQVETKTLNKKQQQSIQDIEKDGVAVLITISAELYSGDKYIGDDFKGGKAEVKVPLELKDDETGEEYSVLYVDDNGEMWPVDCEYKNGHLHFITGHFSEYVIVKNEQKTDAVEKPEDDQNESQNGSGEDSFGEIGADDNSSGIMGGIGRVATIIIVGILLIGLVVIGAVAVASKKKKVKK